MTMHDCNVYWPTPCPEGSHPDRDTPVLTDEQRHDIGLCICSFLPEGDEPWLKCAVAISEDAAYEAHKEAHRIKHHDCDDIDDLPF